jgi:hypothetical protein
VDDRFDLLPVSHDPAVREEASDVGFVEAGDLLEIPSLSTSGETLTIEDR